MLTLLFIIALAFMIVFIILGNNTQKHDDIGFFVGALLTGFIAFVLLISVVYQSYQVFCRANTIQTQIEMYEDENSKIEEKINTVVQDYLEHEKETYNDIKPENVIAALSMFPELNSSELVKKEIEIYQSNEAKLIELKEEQITGIPMARYLLYFGN